MRLCPGARTTCLLIGDSEMAHPVDPFRGEGFLHGRKRRQSLERCGQLHDRLTEMDHKLDEMAKERHQTAQALRSEHRRLWPSLNKRARRPLGDGRRALPPIPNDAIGLSGRRLRATCIDILRQRAQACTLIELHAMLHRRGYFIHTSDTVKVLADAMRYEVLKDRIERVSRGTYQLLG